MSSVIHLSFSMTNIKSSSPCEFQAVWGDLLLPPVNINSRTQFFLSQNIFWTCSLTIEHISNVVLKSSSKDKTLIKC